jgi:hypothetical protein
MNCLKDLPVHDPTNFTNVTRDPTKKTRPKVVFNVSKQEDEKKIAADKMPLLIKYLQNHWSVHPEKRKFRNSDQRQSLSSSQTAGPSADSESAGGSMQAPEATTARPVASSSSSAAASTSRRGTRKPTASTPDSSSGSEGVPAKNRRI